MSEASIEGALVVNEPIELARLKERFGEGVLGHKVDRGELYVFVDRQIIPEVLGLLRADTDLDYNYFSECLGVDYSTWIGPRDLPERFEVVYNLMSVSRATRIFVKVGANDGDLIPTSKHIFLGAEYPEWEIWDMFGITFAGNERQQRFLLPDDWVGHPLRKEYPLGGEDVLFDQGHYGPAVEDIPMPHAGESFEGSAGSDEISGR